MPSTILSTITEIKMMPINSITLIDKSAPFGWFIEDLPEELVVTDSLTLLNVEAESSLQINPITRRTDLGGDRQIAMTFTGTFYVPCSDHVSMDAELSKYTGRQVSAKIKLGGYWEEPGFTGRESQPDIAGYDTKYLYLSAYTTNNNTVEMNYRLEHVETRQRWIVQLNGLIHNLNDTLTSNNTNWWSNE